MARVKKGMNAHKRHKKVLKLAKGYQGSRSKLFKTSNQFVMKALKNAYIGRKQKKRDFRKLWIQRMNGLKKAGVEVNRKMLSELAIADPEGFAKLVAVAKENLA